MRLRIVLQGKWRGEPANSHQHLLGVEAQERKSPCQVAWTRGVPAGALSSAWDPGSELISHGTPSVPYREGVLLDTRTGSKGMICNDIFLINFKEVTYYSDQVRVAPFPISSPTSPPLS